MKMVISGGAGFIGSAVVRRILNATDCHAIVLDNLTYAGNLDALSEVASSPRYRFVKMDICDSAGVHALFEQEEPDAILHLAAETHVDRSINGPENFIQTNVLGIYRLLDSAFRYWCKLDKTRQSRFRFHHVSTDEVYGSVADGQKVAENNPYRPNSPYAASKAASDHLVRAGYYTFGLPVITSNSSNNYGPYQFPEKLIPLMIRRAMKGELLPVYRARMCATGFMSTTMPKHCLKYCSAENRARFIMLAATMSVAISTSCRRSPPCLMRLCPAPARTQS